MINYPANSCRHQGGVALVMSLIILLVMTVLALSSMQGTSLQESMVSAQRDAQIALEGAEHALTEAEALLSQPTVPSFTDSNGLYTETGDAPAGKEYFSSATWASGENPKTQAASMPQVDGRAMLAEAPRFFIQALAADAIADNKTMPLNMGGYGAGEDADIKMTAYRVVARSTGRTGQTPRVIEAYVFR